MPNDRQSPKQLAKRAETARYVVSVDHQPKRSFDTLEAANEEARRILEAFPILTVDVSDAEKNTFTTFGPAQEPEEPNVT